MKRFRITFFILFLLTSFQISAINGGGVNYSQGADALADCFDGVTTMTLYVIYIVNALGGIIALYGALQIYIKMNTGGGDITRSILFLIGGCLFLLFGLVVFPGIFGFELTN